MPRMTKKALALMGRVLVTLQANRSLTDQEVVDQLNQIQDGEVRGTPRNRRPIDRRTWQYWKHGQKEPRPQHLRVLAVWTDVPVGVIKLGQATIARDGSLGWPED